MGRRLSCLVGTTRARSRASLGQFIFLRMPGSTSSRAVSSGPCGVAAHASAMARQRGVAHPGSWLPCQPERGEDRESAHADHTARPSTTATVLLP